METIAARNHYTYAVTWNCHFHEFNFWMRSFIPQAGYALQKTGIPIIFPIHPRTEKMMNQFNLTAPSITLTKPHGYLELLHLESNARLIITDSGGLQEEACILGVPCVTWEENPGLRRKSAKKIPHRRIIRGCKCLNIRFRPVYTYPSPRK